MTGLGNVAVGAVQRVVECAADGYESQQAEQLESSRDNRSRDHPESDALVLAQLVGCDQRGHAR